MIRNLLIACFIFIFLGFSAQSQVNQPVSIEFIKKQNSILPGQIINLPVLIRNNSQTQLQVIPKCTFPANVNLITNIQEIGLKPGEQKVSIVSLQIPSNYPVGDYEILIDIVNNATEQSIASNKTVFKVNEIININMQLVDAPERVFAGNPISAKFLLQNQGNTKKKIFIQTFNIDKIDKADIELNPGESAYFTVLRETSKNLTTTKNEFIKVQAIVGGDVIKSQNRSVMIFPVINKKQDLYFRYPIKLSASYLATNQNETFVSGYQFELSGSGTLDPGGKHELEFMARGPNNTNLSFMGMYDQYYISYKNKNLEVFAGENSYSFTPLTESARYGWGTENKVIFNNGINVGFLYVKPRFYDNISDEFAIYTGYEKNKQNNISLYYVTKKEALSNEIIYMGSINTKFQLLKNSSFDLEYSRGLYQNTWDQAVKANINTRFSIFRLAGNYIYTGKNYPGYFSNSKFYSGSFSVHFTPKINLGIYARQDYTNAQLDTFFVYAPYSKSVRAMLNYSIGSNTFLKIYWMEYERKDRLALDKFHYNTKSVNTQLEKRMRKLEYSLLGEYGFTTNFLLQSLENKQETYRGTLNFMYRLNALNSVRLFGTWSNLNSFVTNEQRNLTAGINITSQISKNLKGNLYIQNAYDIDDYYRNRNLMQLNLDYRFLKKHTLSLRSYYTLFRNQVDNPEFSMAATYTYEFGIPLKQVIKAGEISGKIVNDFDEPVEGVILTMLNKTMITNKNGEFSFKTVTPGIQLLNIDRSTFKIDETTSIPNPIEIEIIEDHQTQLNFKITKGAKVEGEITYDKTNRPSNAEDVRVENIVLELSDEIEQFRIASDENGKFSFPLVRPGNWTLKIFTGSLPELFQIENSVYNLNLNSGDRINLPVQITPKKRNIIFKSEGLSLSNSGTNTTLLKQTGTIKITSNNTPGAPQGAKNDSIFYSVQIGAFRRGVKPNSRFFKEEPFDFEKEIDNLHKYFIGKFDTLEKAENAKARLKQKYKGAFVVLFKNGKIESLSAK